MVENLNQANRTGRISKMAIDRDLCIGCGTCPALAPSVFELDDENKARITDPNGADDATLISTAESCPVKAIALYDQDGGQVVPKI